MLAAGVAALSVAACGRGDIPQSAPTLPPIITTSTSSTTLLVATTLPEYYQVKRGDTLTVIAAAYEIPVQALMDANGLTDPDDIRAGQHLAIPRREDIVATRLPPTVPGQTAPPMPTVPGASAPTSSTP